MSRLSHDFVLNDVLDIFFSSRHVIKRSFTLPFTQEPNLWSIPTEAILLWLYASSHVVNLFTDARCGY